jgi:Fic family protein
MNLFKPVDVRMDEVTAAMAQDLKDLAHQVNEIRPLDGEVLRQVKDELLADRVFNSNAIEGNTLTIRETRLILQTKTVVDIRKKREAQETLNLGEAALRIEQLLEVDGAWHDVSSFLTVHEILMKQVNDRIAGVLRSRDVMISGAKRQPPGSHEVSDLVDKFFDCLRESEHTVGGLALATWAHWAIARIHPFEDGNGRLARLWQDIVLLRSRFTVAIIRPQDRETYLDALGKADEGEFNPLAQLICQRVMSTLQTYINAQEAADALQGWAAEVVGESSARQAERRIDYQRWRLAVEQIGDAFARCASLINRGSNRSLEVQVQNEDIIGQPTWETLLAGGSIKEACFFRVLVRKNRATIWYSFNFGRCLVSRVDFEPIEGEGSFVAILINEHRLADEEHHLPLSATFDDRPAMLRALLISGRRLVRRRWEFETEDTVWDRDVKPIDVAKEFFEDVILRVLK